MWDYGRKYRILIILKPFSVGKFVVCGCDLRKCREFLFSFKKFGSDARRRMSGTQILGILLYVSDEGYCGGKLF